MGFLLTNKHITGGAPPCNIALKFSRITSPSVKNGASMFWKKSVVWCRPFGTFCFVKCPFFVCIQTQIPWYIPQKQGGTQFVASASALDCLSIYFWSTYISPHKKTRKISQLVLVFEISSPAYIEHLSRNNGLARDFITCLGPQNVGVQCRRKRLMCCLG